MWLKTTIFLGRGEKMTVYDADLIVVGGGPIGLAAALYAAKKGKSVIVMEQYSFGNQYGSSADHVRMWRTAITEASHARMAFRAGEMFRELEVEGGTQLLYKHGLLNFGVETGYTEQGTIETAHQVLKSLGHEGIRYTKKQIEERFPFKNLPENYFGYFHPDNAVIDVKSLFATLLKLNTIQGVKMFDSVKVQGVESEANGAIVKTEQRNFYAKKLIVCPGAYVNELVKPLGFELDILFWDMAFAYYQITDPGLYFPMWFQFDFPDEHQPSKLFYGFPAVSFARNGFLRLAVDWASNKYRDLSLRHYVPRDQDIEMTCRYVQDHMRGVAPRPVEMAATIHPQLADNLSVLDFMPEQFVPYHKNIVLFTGGWAFKFIPLFGKICAELAMEGGSDENISELSIHRKGILK